MTPTRRRRIRFALAGLVVLLLGSQAWGWYHLSAARSANAAFRPDEARRAVAAADRVWWWRPAVRLASARAERLAGDLEAAVREQTAARRLAGAPSDELAFEWALARTAGGLVGESDEYLTRRAAADPAAAAAVWEASAAGHLRVYRTLDAKAIVDRWLAAQPDNPRAHELLGQIYVAGRGVTRGAETFRKAVELDPGRRSARVQLVRCLLDLGQYDEALTHLQPLSASTPADPEFAGGLARCLIARGRPADAQSALAPALAAHPDHPALLRIRGQLALAEQDLPGAEEWLRRAAAAGRHDYQAQWLFFQVLQQQGKADEAKRQSAVAEAVKEKGEKLADLRSRRLAERPLDPALHTEMAALLLETDNEPVGEQWLLSALRLNPIFAPAHTLLAELYARRGDLAAAARHRAAAGK